MASRFNQSRQIKPLATEFTALAIACAIALVVVLAILFAYTAIASDDNLADSDASVPLTVKPANDVVDDIATGIVSRDTEQQLSILDPSLIPASFMQLLLEPGQDTLAIGQMLLAVWDNSMVPMALETLHFSYDPEVIEVLYALLKLGTGENFGPDSDAWYRWWWRQPEINHTYYSQFKASLYRVMDVKFSGYFAPQPRADIRLDEVRWGGVRQDGIPPLLWSTTVMPEPIRKEFWPGMKCLLMTLVVRNTLVSIAHFVALLFCTKQRLTAYAMRLVQADFSIVRIS